MSSVRTDNGQQGAGRSDDLWSVDYSAHPLLDPLFPSRQSRLLELMRATYRGISRDDLAYRQELARLHFPRYAGDADKASLMSLINRSRIFLREADIYLASIIDLLPEPCRRPVMPLPEVTYCKDMRDLMHIAFRGASERQRYEARRKLYLAQLLLQIEQSRSIQDGPRHLAIFEGLLDRELWRFKRSEYSLDVGYRISSDGRSIRYTSRPTKDDQLWHFRSRFLEKPHNGRTVSLDILYYNCRFKRSVDRIGFEVVDGQHRVLEGERWAGMRQASSGSILSKMVRKGINNPGEIDDLIGAMFIVNDTGALSDLLLLLDSCVGTPFGWRNVTDTLAATPEGATLNAYSSREFKVYKGDMDILTTDDVGEPPYRFPVEIQILTLEGYLRTVCGKHEANHRALKQRQFLFGLVPRVFPRRIYGTEWFEGVQA